MRTVTPGGTSTVVAASGERSERPVTRAATGEGPGLARKTDTTHPDPPPCGQIHAPEGAVPPLAAAGEGGPVRSRSSSPVATATTVPTAANACPRARKDRRSLIVPPASW